jgi:NAD(P)-dependent dehydrogenase (short-subunit alcohol dehydrogenase family)
MENVALITGSGVRIGREIAAHLANKGWNLALHYCTSSDQVYKLTAELSSSYPEQHFYPFQTDFSLADQTQKLIRLVIGRFGKLNLLINNASVFEPSSLRASSAELLMRHTMINFISPLILMRDYANFIDNGQIINILDTRITSNKSDYLAYTLSKKSVWESTKMAALELAPHFRVNAIAPGAVLPPAGKGEDYLNELALKIPMKRPSGMTPILQSIDYIIENQYLTGQLLFCNGGSHL